MTLSLTKQNLQLLYYLALASKFLWAGWLKPQSFTSKHWKYELWTAPGGCHPKYLYVLFDIYPTVLATLPFIDSTFWSSPQCDLVSYYKDTTPVGLSYCLESIWLHIFNYFFRDLSPSCHIMQFKPEACNTKKCIHLESQTVLASCTFGECLFIDRVSPTDYQGQQTDAEARHKMWTVRTWSVFTVAMSLNTW